MAAADGAQAAAGAGATGSESPSPPPRESPAGAQAVGAAADDAFAERPELYVGAAFLGGVVAAQILRAIGR